MVPLRIDGGVVLLRAVCFTTLWLPAALGTCPAGASAPVLQRYLFAEASYGLRASDGAVLPLPATISAPIQLPVGGSLDLNCRRYHSGLQGTLHLRCTVDAGLVADISDCVRLGCVWNRYLSGYESASGGPPYQVARGPRSPNASLDVEQMWSSGVLAPDGSVYAVPKAGAGVLRIVTSDPMSMELLPGPSLSLGLDYLGDASKYANAILGLDGYVYGVPSSAAAVLRVRPTSALEQREAADVTVFGSLGTERGKWSHGVLAGDGCIYAVPAASSAVLRIDLRLMSTSFLAGPPLGSAPNKWTHAVIVGSGEVYGIPGDAAVVLRIDVVSSNVTTFGSLGELQSKWSHGVLAGDGSIYGAPSNADGVLRVTPGALASVEVLGQGLQQGVGYKYTFAVVAADQAVYFVPGNARQVLRFDPSTGAFSLIGALGSTSSKYAHAIAAPDGNVYAVPVAAPRPLRIRLATANSPVVVEEFGDVIDASAASYLSAVLVPDGAIIGVPGASPTSLRIAPLRTGNQSACWVGLRGADVICTLGLPCQAVFGVDSAYAVVFNSSQMWLAITKEILLVAVVEVGEPCSRQISPWEVPGVPCVLSPLTLSAGHDQIVFDLNTPIAFPALLGYEIGVCVAASSDSDALLLGRFLLYGPRQTSARCLIFQPCSLELVGPGLLPLQSRLLLGLGVEGSFDNISMSATLCMDVASEATASEHTSGFTFSAVANDSMNNATNASIAVGSVEKEVTFLFGVPTGEELGAYILCWSSAALDNDAFSKSFVFVGHLSVVGPSSIQPFPGSLGNLTIECWVDLHCDLQVDGFGLDDANWLSIRVGVSCAGELASVVGFSDSWFRSSDGHNYSLGVASVGGGNWSLCWHYNEETLGVRYGSLSIYGLVNTSHPLDVACFLGQPCAFSVASPYFYTARGRALGPTNRLCLAPAVTNGSEKVCSSHAIAPWRNVSDPAQPQGGSPFANYSLGIPLANNFTQTLAMVGTYAICFSPNGSPSTFRIYLGTLVLTDSPCHIPAVSGGMSPPCRLQSSQALVSMLQNQDVCMPLCSNLTRLSPPTFLYCVYGSLIPPSFACLRSCFSPPLVRNGFELPECVGLAAGQRCQVRCPTQTTKSGDLLCSDGDFIHVPLIASNLLFDVPRCYNSCAVPNSCLGMSGSILRHGESCMPSCAGVNLQLARVSCFDGKLSPRNFSCNGCNVAPDVRFAQDSVLQCVGAANGSLCQLFCQPGFAKTGDPICINGHWTEESCHQVCVPPSVLYGGYPTPCQGVKLTLFPNETCIPSCRPSYTPALYAPWSSDFAGSFPGNTSFFVLHCNDGQLTPPTFKCMASCDEPGYFAFASVSRLQGCKSTLHGDYCVSPCIEGWYESQPLVCNDGLWSSISCEQGCLDAPEVRYGSVNLTCKNVVANFSCEVACDAGYIATATAICLQGTWTEVQCLADCAAPAQVPFALEPSCAEGLVLRSGSSCSSRCTFSFQARPSTLTCKDGMLTPSNFYCEKFCGDLPPIPNLGGTSVCANLLVGSSCRLPCSPGYRGIGDLYCGVDGWRTLFNISLAPWERRLVPGRLVARIDSSAEFRLALDMTLLAEADAEYESVLHLTTNGSDRIPAIMVAPRRVEATGRQLQVYMDPRVGCRLFPPLTLRQPTKIEMELSDTMLRAWIDGVLACNVSYPYLRGPSQNVSVYAGSPFVPASKANVSGLIYVQQGLEMTLPSCAPVLCNDPLPPVSGEDTAWIKPPGCNGTAVIFGTHCSAVVCGEHRFLDSLFVCGASGKWEPAASSMPECQPIQCPLVPPSAGPGSVEAETCHFRQYGSVCQPSCAWNFRPLGSFTCMASGTWTPTANATPRCAPERCDLAPAILGGARAKACDGLLSGTTCLAACLAPLRPFLEYRCYAQFWVEVPMCLPFDSNGSGVNEELRPVLTGGLALHPSVDVVNYFRSPQEWARAASASVAAAFAVSLWGDKSFPGVFVTTGSMVYASSASGRRTVGPTRALQGLLPEGIWTMDMSYMIVSAVSDTASVAAKIGDFNSTRLGAAVVDALPVGFAPSRIDVFLSKPSIAQLPSAVSQRLAELYKDLPVALSTDVDSLGLPVETTSTLRGLSRDTTTLLVNEVGAAALESSGVGGLNAAHWSIIAVSIVTLISALLAFYRFRKHLNRRAHDVSKVDIAEHSFAKEPSRHQDTAENVNEVALHAFVERRKIQQQRVHLVNLAKRMNNAVWRSSSFTAVPAPFQPTVDLQAQDLEADGESTAGNDDGAGHRGSIQSVFMTLSTVGKISSLGDDDVGREVSSKSSRWNFFDFPGMSRLCAPWRAVTPYATWYQQENIPKLRTGDADMRGGNPMSHALKALEDRRRSETLSVYALGPPNRKKFVASPSKQAKFHDDKESERSHRENVFCYPEVLRVRIIGAANLRDPDETDQTSRFSRIYCNCSLDGRSKTTTPVHEGESINPVWNYDKIFKNFFKGQEVHFQIFDKKTPPDWTVSGDFPLGRGVLRSADYYDTGFEGAIKLSNTMRQGNGPPPVLNAKVWRTLAPLPVPKMRVYILAAKDLLPGSFDISKPERYVEFSVNSRNAKSKTKVVRDDLNPVFRFASTISAYECDDVLCFIVLDAQSSSLSNEDHFGKVHLPIRTELEKRYEGNYPRGCILELELFASEPDDVGARKLHVRKSLSWGSESDHSWENHSESQAVPTTSTLVVGVYFEQVSLRLTIVSATNLTTVGDRLPSPFVKVSIFGRNVDIKTPVITEEQNPSWNFEATTSEFEVGDAVEFEVFSSSFDGSLVSLGKSHVKPSPQIPLDCTIRLSKTRGFKSMLVVKAEVILLHALPSAEMVMAEWEEQFGKVGASAKMEASSDSSSSISFDPVSSHCDHEGERKLPEVVRAAIARAKQLPLYMESHATDRSPNKRLREAAISRLRYNPDAEEPELDPMPRLVGHPRFDLGSVWACGR